MAPSFRRSPPHARRALAGPSGESSAPAPTLTAALSASPTPSSSRSAHHGVSLPPQGTAAIVSIVVVLSVLVLSFAACRIWIWRGAKKSPTLPNKSNEKLWEGSSVSDTYSLRRTMSQASSTVNIAYPADVQPAVTRDHFPGAFKVNLNYQPKVIYSAPQEESTKSQAPLPGISVSPSPPILQIRPPPSYAEIPVSALSPRSASRSPSTRTIPPSSKLPRLVVVESTFSTTLHDELEVREGETLRLLEEYEDQWCLVQRVGGLDAEKGVVPRFCVVDKPDVLPLRKSKHISRLTSTPKI